MKLKLTLESNNLADYLREEPPVITFSTPAVAEAIAWIRAQAATPKERAVRAFELARDEVKHSFDTQNAAVTVSGEDALCARDGICFAKSHLLACLLRGMGIPAGFCYQRVLRKGTVESGYALHGLNAVHLPEHGWFRLDPRGNKPGVDAQFSVEDEKLAYPIRPELGEVDYPDVFVSPLPAVIVAMRESRTSQELFFKRPEKI